LNETVRVLTSQNWENEVANSPEPVLVDFWAEWCPPCRQLAPTIDALAQEYAGRVKVGKLNVDEHQDVAARFGIHAIPALLVFRGGQLIDQRLGNLPREEVRRLLETQLGSPVKR
jgi:thioredoxin 1